MTIPLNENKHEDEIVTKGAKVEILSGPLDGLEFNLNKDVITIGRDKDKDIPIPLDILISRSHAIISYENKEYWLEDAGSRNGTYIDTKIISEKTRLQHNMIFRVGVSEMRLLKTNI